MHYPHRITIKRLIAGAGQASGSQNDDTGDWVAPPNAKPASVFDRARCDVQELSLSVSRRQDGTQTENADVQCFLEDEDSIGLVNIGDIANVEWEDGTTSDSEVKSIRRLDGSLVLRFLR